MSEIKLTFKRDKSNKLVLNSIKYTDALFNKIEKYCKDLYEKCGDYKTFREQSTDYTLDNPLITTGFMEHMGTLMDKVIADVSFSQQGQKELVRTMIQNTVADLVLNAGEDLKEHIKQVTLDAYENHIAPQDYWENLQVPPLVKGEDGAKRSISVRERCKMIARTETARTQNVANYVIGKDSGAKYWYALGFTDNKTCNECIEKFGTPSDPVYYDIEDIGYMPPIHPNCRHAAVFTRDLPKGAKRGSSNVGEGETTSTKPTDKPKPKETPKEPVKKEPLKKEKKVGKSKPEPKATPKKKRRRKRKRKTVVPKRPKKKKTTKKKSTAKKKTPKKKTPTGKKKPEKKKKREEEPELPAKKEIDLDYFEQLGDSGLFIGEAKYLPELGYELVKVGEDYYLNGLKVLYDGEYVTLDYSSVQEHNKKVQEEKKLLDHLFKRDEKKSPKKPKRPKKKYEDLKTPEDIAEYFDMKYDKKKKRFIDDNFDTIIDLKEYENLEDPFGNPIIDFQNRGKDYGTGAQYYDLKEVIKIYSEAPDILKYATDEVSFKNSSQGNTLAQARPGDFVRNKFVPNRHIDIFLGAVQKSKKKRGNLRQSWYHEMGHCLDFALIPKKHVKKLLNPLENNITPSMYMPYLMSCLGICQTEEWEYVNGLDLQHQSDNGYPMELMSWYAKQGKWENWAETCSIAAISFLDDHSEGNMENYNIRTVKYDDILKRHPNVIKYARKMLTTIKPSDFNW